MMAITPLMILSALIPTALAILALLMGKKSIKDPQKLSPFECGFDPFKTTRVPFSLRFFLVTILFLIFDVEIALLLPLGLYNPLNLTWQLSLSTLTILLILVLGLLHEWNQTALDWL